MLRIAVKRGARHAVERRFLGNISRIGHYTLCICREIAELQIRQRLNNAEVIQAFCKRPYRLRSRRTQRSKYLNAVCRAAHCRQHGLKVWRIGQQDLAVERENDILTLLHLQHVKHRRTNKPRAVEAQSIHQDVADHVDFRKLRSLTGCYAGASNACREKQIRQPVDYKTVDFLGHPDVKRARAGHKMRQRKPMFLRNYGNSHRRSKVVNDNHYICLTGGKIRVELRHHAPCKLVEVDTIHAKIHIRHRYGQISEERRLKRGVARRSGVHQTVINCLAVGFRLDDGTHQRSHLYEVRARPCDDTYILHFFLFLKL